VIGKGSYINLTGLTNGQKYDTTAVSSCAVVVASIQNKLGVHDKRLLHFLTLSLVWAQSKLMQWSCYIEDV